MGWVVLTAILFLGGAGIYLSRSPAGGPGQVYRRRRDWPPVAWRRLLPGLVEAAGPEWRVFPGLPAAALLEPVERIDAGGLDPAERVDFLLCAAEDLSLAAVAFLERREPERTLQLERLFESAGIPTAILQGSESPDQLRGLLDELLVGRRERVEEGAFGSAGADSRAADSRAADSRAADSRAVDSHPADFRPAGGDSQKADHPPDAPKQSEPARAATGRRCPKCGQAMKRRKIAKGAQAGRIVWACSDYPHCKTVLPDRSGEG